MADESKAPLYEDPHCDDEDEEMDRRISQVAFVAYQQAKMKGLPVARYDAEKKAAPGSFSARSPLYLPY